MDIHYLADIPKALPMVAQWLFDEWGHYKENNSLEKAQEKLRTHLSKEELPIIVVATLNTIPVGTASLRQSDGIENRPDFSPWLASVYVAKEYRQRGIGTQLIQHILDIAKHKGNSKLYLRTEDKVTFYQNLGWATVEKLDSENALTTIMSYSL